MLGGPHLCWFTLGYILVCIHIILIYTLYYIYVVHYTYIKHHIYIYVCITIWYIIHIFCKLHDVTKSVAAAAVRKFVTRLKITGSPSSLDTIGADSSAEIGAYHGLDSVQHVCRDVVPAIRHSA